jgi:hypothetical protein
MVSVDLVIKNGSIVTPTDIVETGIVIDDGKIISLSLTILNLLNQKELLMRKEN